LLLQRSKIQFIPLGVLLLGLAFFLTHRVAGARGLPVQDGIRNFGKISDAVFRGAQPDALGITNLARLGVKMIINLRMTNDIWNPEERLARAQGILYTNLPLRGMGRPTDQQVRGILEAIEAAPGPVFVHCQHGCDRTGAIVACYRIQHDKWTSDAALKEAVLYGMSKFERGLKRYVVDFGKALSSGRVASASSP